jgi:hypothetical protein
MRVAESYTYEFAPVVLSNQKMSRFSTDITSTQ